MNKARYAIVALLGILISMTTACNNASSSTTMSGTTSADVYSLSTSNQSNNAADFHVRRIATQNGNVRWQQTVHLNSTVADMRVTSNNVFLTTTDTIVALDATNGQAMWQKQASDIVNFPRATDDTLYIETNDTTAQGSIGNLTAFNRQDGSIRWQIDIGRDAVVTPFQDQVFLELYGGGRDSTAQFASNFLEVEAATGKITWQAPAPGLGETHLIGQTLYGLSQAGYTALDANTKQTRWTYPLTQGVDYEGFAADQHAIYIAPGRQQVVALDLSNGHQLWSAAITNDNQDRIWLCAGKQNIATITQTQGSGFTLSQGAHSWSHPLSSQSGAGVTINPGFCDNDTMYFGLSPVAISVSNGQSLWSAASVAITKETVIIPLGDQVVSGGFDANDHPSVFSLDSRSGKVRWTVPIENTQQLTLDTPAFDLLQI